MCTSKDRVKLAILTLIYVLVALSLFPTTIKIQFSSSAAELSISGYNDECIVAPRREMEEEVLGELRFANFSWKEIKESDSLKIYSGDENSDISFSHLKIALLNTVIYENENQDNDTEIELDAIKNAVSTKVFVYRLGYVSICVVLLIGILMVLRKRDIAEWCGKKHLGNIEEVGLRLLIFGISGFALINIRKAFFLDFFIEDSEILLGMLALFVVYELLMHRTDDKTVSCVGMLIIGIGIFVSVERLTTFLTTDEATSIDIMNGFPSGTLRPWLYSESRASYVIMGTLWKMIPSLERYTSLSYYQWAKILHWVVGFSMIIAIVDIAQSKIINCGGRKTEDAKRIAFNYVLLLNSFLLLPVLELGMKNYNNYDLFSMLLAVLGIEWVYLGLRDSNLKSSYLGLILECVAFLEKLSAMPIYLFAAVTVVFVAHAVRKRNILFDAFVETIKIALVSLASSAIIQMYVVYVLAKNRTIILSISDILKVIAITLERVIWKVGGILGIEKLASGDNIYTLTASYVSMYLGIFICSIIVCALIHKIQNRTFKAFRQISLMAFMAYLLIGVFFAYTSTTYDGTHISFLKNLMWRVPNGFPTVMLLILIFLILTCKYNKEESLIYVLLPVGLIGMTISYVLINEFLDIRYFNMYMCIYVLCIMILFLQTMSHINVNDIKLAVSSLLLSLLIALEIGASSPAYSFFYPIWNRAICNDERGLYAYWGEQMAIAGEEVRKYCQRNEINLEEVVLHTGYPGGQWIKNKYGVNMIPSSLWTEDLTYRTTNKTDFYLYDTQAVMRGMIPYEIPKDIEPIITITYRGAVTARIYQGTQLEDYFQQSIK